MELVISEHDTEQVGDVKLYNPWNPINKDVPDSEILRILSTYGVRDVPLNYDLFKQAFVHRSYVDRPEGPSVQNAGDRVIVVPRPEGVMPLKLADNEELEHHGDGILQAVTAEYLCMRYPGEGEGFWTSLRSNLVNNTFLFNVSDDTGLYNCSIIIKRHLKIF